MLWRGPHDVYSAFPSHVTVFVKHLFFKALYVHKFIFSAEQISKLILFHHCIHSSRQKGYASIAELMQNINCFHNFHQLSYPFGDLTKSQCLDELLQLGFISYRSPP